MYIYIYLFVCLFVCLFIYLFILFICLFMYLFSFLGKRGLGRGNSRAFCILFVCLGKPKEFVFEQQLARIDPLGRVVLRRDTQGTPMSDVFWGERGLLKGTL